MTPDQWIAATATAAAVGVFIASVVTIVVGLTGVRDQLRTAVFITYTGRYSKIMSQLPFQARRPGSGYSLDSVSQAERMRVLAAFREYFNLCSEELWLHSTGKIDDATWSAWELGMEDTARFPCFIEAWRYLEVEYAVYEFFSKFMRRLIEKTAAAPWHPDTTMLSETATA